VDVTVSGQPAASAKEAEETAAKALVDDPLFNTLLNFEHNVQVNEQLAKKEAIKANQGQPKANQGQPPVIQGQVVQEAQPAVVQGQVVQGQAVAGTPIPANAFQQQQGFVGCAVHDPRLGHVCGAPAQFVCVQCGRAVCINHRRFFMGQIACANCQDHNVRNLGQQPILCCTVQ